MILLIDNYDSFTWNLVQALWSLGETVHVVENDRITLDEIAASKPAGIVISPGPCTPKEAGVSVPLVQRFAASVPILGVCLGHQSIGAAFGAEVVRAPLPMHGKVSRVRHDGRGLFTGVSAPMLATRYHSLHVTKLPAALRVTATSEDDGLVMAMEHAAHPVFGVQFHPESIATQDGVTLLQNFVRRTRA
ncbi:MAG: aminodeoxychorismate/anthranilate synthase component II [Deltaproteobacteria bacterium]|nr:aminodeoxychorismate/anthranilate synthase component II [Deltaproteobacteria bacterium]